VRNNQPGNALRTMKLFSGSEDARRLAHWTEKMMSSTPRAVLIMTGKTSKTGSLERGKTIAIRSRRIASANQGFHISRMMYASVPVVLIPANGDRMLLTMRCMTSPAAMIPKLRDKTLRMKMGVRRVYGFESANRRTRSGRSIEPKTVAMRM